MKVVLSFIACFVLLALIGRSIFNSYNALGVQTSGRAARVLIPVAVIAGIAFVGLVVVFHSIQRRG
jgi:hypothetical protein